MFSISVGAESTAQKASQPAVHQVPINLALQIVLTNGVVEAARDHSDNRRDGHRIDLRHFQER